VRTRMYAPGLIASIVLLVGGLTVPQGPLRSWTSVLSIEARASEGIAARADVCRWNDVGWADMSDVQRTAWQILGWTSSTWESEPAVQPPSSSKAWVNLSGDERSAARRLGYRPGTWDADNCKSR
jgi:hypothetical protein